MSLKPIICFGQQPCGIFPKRFLVAKMRTARRLQAEIGGEIVFFYHDSDHDPRETRTLLRHRKTGEPAQLNFTFENRWQRKFSPLAQKRIPGDWQERMVRTLPNYVEHPLIRLFEEVREKQVGSFCLEMYGRMNLLHGMRVAASSDPGFRNAAAPVEDFFVDLPYEGETVRARFHGNEFLLHEGGQEFLHLPMTAFGKDQISPTRDSRFAWMQSVIGCTHYIAGASEQDYLSRGNFPEVTFVHREAIEDPHEAYIQIEN